MRGAGGRWWRVAVALGALLALPGCISIHSATNPAASLEKSEARKQLAAMRIDTVDLDRPVVVINGYRALPSNMKGLATGLRRATSADNGDFLEVSFTFVDNIDEAAARVIAAVNERWEPADNGETIEVDVVGVSMGGLVARWASLPPEDRVRVWEGDRAGPPPLGRLRVRRLYTLGTPHQGSVLADRITIDQAGRDMVPGSPFLNYLNSLFHRADYELVCYTHLRDRWVGARYTAPPGRVPIWTNGTLLFSHFEVHRNPVFIADIARRLRGEEPLLREGEMPPRD